MIECKECRHELKAEEIGCCESCYNLAFQNIQESQTKYWKSLFAMENMLDCELCSDVDYNDMTLKQLREDR